MNVTAGHAGVVVDRLVCLYCVGGERKSLRIVAAPVMDPREIFERATKSLSILEQAGEFKSLLRIR